MDGGRETAQTEDMILRKKERRHMIAKGFVDDVEANDAYSDFFDHIDDLLDFPNEEIDGGLDGCWTTDPGALALSAASSDVGERSRSSSRSVEEEDLAPLAVPSDELAELEWLSTFMDDSFFAGKLDLDNDCSNEESKVGEIITGSGAGDHHHADADADADAHLNQSNFHTSSPISVLESSSSCPGKTALFGLHVVFPGRARSKRPRRPSSSLVHSASSDSSSELFSDLKGGFPEELLSQPPPPPRLQPKVPKKKKMPIPPSKDSGGAASPRKCLHCEIQKTPQWRMGPLGPKTLCNACGVRYKSGRLYPEYRPAASPTFVSTLHSNSHKKVLEMRVKTGTNSPAPTPEFVRKTSVHLLDCA